MGFEVICLEKTWSPREVIQKKFHPYFYNTEIDNHLVFGMIILTIRA